MEKTIGLRQQEDWDNSGLQCGSYESDITGVILTMDITEECIEFCKKTNSNLIISHHPLLFKSTKSINTDTYLGKIVKELILGDITAISLHTTLDLAEYGVNRCLADVLNIKATEYLVSSDIKPQENYGYGFVSDIEPITLIDYALCVKKELKCDNVKLYSKNVNKIIKRVAFCGGGASDFIGSAISKNADVYITGDIKYHDAQFAINNGLAIIDAGHFNTEVVVLSRLKSYIEEKIENVNICDINYVNSVII